MNVQQASILSLYIGSCTILTLLIKSSTTIFGYYPFELLTVVLLTELCKLIFSGITILVQSKNAKKTIKETISWWPTGIYFIIPGLTYTFYNTMIFYNLSHFDPISYYVLRNIRIPITALLFQIVLDKKLSHKKWIAIFLLLSACCLNQWNSSINILSNNFQFWINIIVQAFIGSLGDIYSELLLKNDSKVPIHVKNFYLYCFTSLFCFLFILITKSDVMASYNIFFGGYSFTTYLIIFFGAFSGILTSFVLQYFNAIIKNYGKGFEMIIVAFASVLFFPGQQIGTNVFLSVLLIVISLMLFYNAKSEKGISLP